MDPIPLTVTALIVIIASAISNRAWKQVKRSEQDLPRPDDAETFRTRYFWPQNRADMPTRFRDHADNVDHARRISYACAAIAFGAFFGWIVLERAA